MRVRQPVMYAQLQSTMPVIVCYAQTRRNNTRASSFFFSDHESYRRVIYMCVCMGDKHGVYAYKEAPRPPTAHSSHIIQRMTESGTLAEAAVQTNSRHSERENKARFEETSFGILQRRNGQRGRTTPPPKSFMWEEFCYEVLSQRYSTCLTQEFIHNNTQSYNFGDDLDCRQISPPLPLRQSVFTFEWKRRCFC